MLLEKKLNIGNEVYVYTKQKVPGLKNAEEDSLYKNRGEVVGSDSTGVYEIRFEAKETDALTKYVKIDKDPQHVMSIKDGDPKRSNIRKVKLVS